MLTPQDIQNKEFTKAVFGGYDMTVVDDFLEDIAEDYANLYKENSVLKSKIKVLVEKVEEYRSTEDAMRMALLTAQKMGDDLLVDAKQKSTNLLSDAEQQANRRMKEATDAVKAEEARLNMAKTRTAQFVQAAEEAIKKYTDFLEKLPDYEVKAPAKTEPAPAPAPAPKAAAAQEKKAGKSEQEIVDTAREIDAYVSKMLDGEPAPSAKTRDDDDDQTRVFRVKGDDTDWSDEDEPTSPRPKFDFDDLKFGSNYDKD